MLSLTRKNGERIRLRLPGGEEIWIKYVQKGNGTYAMIAIEAPQNVEIAREELLPENERWNAQ